MMKKRNVDGYFLIRCTKCNKVILKAESETKLKNMVLNGYGKENIACPHCSHVHLNPYYNKSNSN